MFCTKCTRKFVHCPCCGNRCDAIGDAGIESTQVHAEVDGTDYELSKGEDEYRIVIFGMYRSDIVSTTNTILGEKRLKPGTGVENMTIPCHLERGQRYGKVLQIVATTGFQDVSLQDKLAGLKSAIDLLKPGANVLILVTSINEFSEEERFLVRCLERLGDLSNYAVVLFTHFDENEDDRNLVRQQIKSSEKLQKLLQFSNNRFELLDTSSKNETQIKAVFEIMQKILQENKFKYFNTTLFTEKSEAEIQDIIKEKNDKRIQQIGVLQKNAF